MAVVQLVCTYLHRILSQSWEFLSYWNWFHRPTDFIFLPKTFIPLFSSIVFSANLTLNALMSALALRLISLNIFVTVFKTNYSRNLWQMCVKFSVSCKHFWFICWLDIIFFIFDANTFHEYTLKIFVTVSIRWIFEFTLWRMKAEYTVRGLFQNSSERIVPSITISFRQIFSSIQ